MKKKADGMWRSSGGIEEIGGVRSVASLGTWPTNAEGGRSKQKES